MSVTKEQKKTKQNLMQTKIKTFKSNLISQSSGTFVPLETIIAFLTEIEELAKQYSKTLSLAEVVIHCTPSNDNDKYFKDLLQRNLYKIYIT